MTTEAWVLAPRLIVKVPAIGQCSTRTATTSGARGSISTPWRWNATSPKRLQEVKNRNATCSGDLPELPPTSAVGYKRRQYDRSKTHGPLSHWNCTRVNNR